MGYELYMFPPEETPGIPIQSIIEAFQRAGARSAEQPDDFGHWLVLDGYESALNLTAADGKITYAGFRFTPVDDESVITTVTEVFKSLGWQVSDDEGFL